MDPHIGYILIGNTIGEPFMTCFMDDDKIEFKTPTSAGEITAQVSILIFIPVGNGTLMFHA